MKETTSKKDKEALSLEEIRLSATEPKLFSNIIFYFLFLMLCTGASLGCLYSSFDISVSVPAAIFFFLIFSAVFTAVFTMKRKNTGFVIAAAGVGALFVLLFRSSVYKGFLFLAKDVIRQFRENGSAVSFPSGWDSYLENADYSFDSTVFLLALMYAFIFLEAWAIIRRRNFLLAALVTLPFIIAPVLVPITPHFIPLALLFSFYGMSLFLSPVISGEKIFKQGFKGYHISSPSAATPTAFSAVSIVISLMLVIALAFPASSYNRSEFLDALRLCLVNGFDSTEISRYLSTSFGGDISTVNLSEAGDVSFTDQPILRLTLTDGTGLRKEKNGHSEYIKRYVGSVYSEDGWSLLSDDKAEDVRNILGGYSTQQNFKNISQIIYPNTYFYTFSIAAEWCGTGNPRLVYTPYNISSISPEDELTYVDDGYITAKDESRGIDSYSYSAYSSASFENSTLEDMVQELYDKSTSSYDIEDYLEGVEVEDGIIKIDEDGYIFFYDKYGAGHSTGQRIDLSEYYSSRSEDESQASLSVEDMIAELYSSNSITSTQYNYLNTLIEYNEFVEENYTQLPDDERSFLQDFIKEKNISTASMDETILDIMELLTSSGEYEYTLSPGKTPSGEDFAEYFLTQNKKGYCKHFATSAVLLLRAAGIPARYVEGFKFDTSELLNSGAIELLDSNAHSWVEVYYSGTGWTALDFTPSVSSSSESSLSESSEESSTPPESSGAEHSTSDSELTESSTGSGESSEAAAETSSERSFLESEGSNYSVIVYILFIPLCAAAAFISLWLNRFVRLKRRKSRLKRMNQNEVLLEIYSRIVQLLLYRENYNEIDSEYSCIQQLIERENVSEERKRRCRIFCDEIYPLAQKAKFSSDGVSAEELKAVLAYYKQFRSETMDSMSFIQRFSAKYLDVL